MSWKKEKKWLRKEITLETGQAYILTSIMSYFFYKGRLALSHTSIQQAQKVIEVLAHL